MIRCPVSHRRVSQVIDGAYSAWPMNNSSLIVFRAKTGVEGVYPIGYRGEIYRTGMVMFDDLIWDELFTTFQDEWTIVIGTRPYPLRDRFEIEKGAPILGWIAVKFSSDDDKVLFQLKAKSIVLKSPYIDLQDDISPPGFDDRFIAPCSQLERRVAAVNDATLAKLENCVVIHTGRSSKKHGRHPSLINAKLSFRTVRASEGQVSPHRIFDHLHTYYRDRWSLYINGFSFGCDPRLVVSFRTSEDLKEFCRTWNDSEIEHQLAAKEALAKETYLIENAS